MNRANAAPWSRIAAGMFLIAGLALWSGCSSKESAKSESPAQAAAKAEQAKRPMAADFTLHALDGSEVSLRQFRGKVVLLNFWATWCGPCRREIPDFIAMTDDYKDKDFEIIGVSVDQGGVNQVRPFVRSAKINYTILVDGGRISPAYGGIPSIPTTFMIDREGRIAEKFVGLRGRHVFENAAQRLLAEG